MKKIPYLDSFASHESSSLFSRKSKNEDGSAKTEQTAKADGTVGSKAQGAAQKKQKWLTRETTTASKEIR